MGSPGYGPALVYSGQGFLALTYDVWRMRRLSSSGSSNRLFYGGKPPHVMDRVKVTGADMNGGVAVFQLIIFSHKSQSVIITSCVYDL